MGAQLHDGDKDGPAQEGRRCRLQTRRMRQLESKAFNRAEIQAHDEAEQWAGCSCQEPGFARQNRDACNRITCAGIHRLPRSACMKVRGRQAHQAYCAFDQPAPNPMQRVIPSEAWDSHAKEGAYGDDKERALGGHHVSGWVSIQGRPSGDCNPSTLSPPEGVSLIWIPLRQASSKLLARRFDHEESAHPFPARTRIHCRAELLGFERFNYGEIGDGSDWLP